MAKAAASFPAGLWISGQSTSASRTVPKSWTSKVSPSITRVTTPLASSGVAMDRGVRSANIRRANIFEPGIMLYLAVVGVM